MSIAISIIIILELITLAFIVWGFFHEERFVAFDDKIISKVRKEIRYIKREACARYLAKQGIIIPKQKGDK